MTDARARVRRALSTVGLLAAAWSAVLVVTHGVAFSLGPLHLSSRNARNPALGALLVWIAAGVCAPAGVRVLTVAGDILRPLSRLGRVMAASGSRTFGRVWQAASQPPGTSVLVAGMVALLLATSWVRGAYVAGGSDSYGYVSEAHLFATGRLRADLPLAHKFPHVSIQALTPLGYRPAEDGSAALVPTYAPGLPLTMAVVERAAGMQAVYAVMPLLAAVAVWSSYRLGMHLVGPGTGVGAALLVCTTPAFVFQLVGAPMSDVPATGWWALALSLLVRNTRVTAAGAGVAAGLAILTRPNLLLVVVVLGLYLLWPLVIDRHQRRNALIRLVLFSLPVVGACLGVAALNAAWYGSPFRSGYSADLFNVRFWKDNVLNYPRWLSETQTPLLLLGFAAPLGVQWLKQGGPEAPTEGPAEGRPLHATDAARRSTAWLLAGVAATVFLSYVFYMPFDVWWYLRFLLPAYPALAVLTCTALAAFATRFGPAARVVAIAAVVAAVSFAYSFGKDMEGLGEHRYRLIAEWVRDHLPERSVIVTMQHSGSMLHYSGRNIVRYDLVPRGDYEAALDEMIRAGYHPYLVVDEWEIAGIRQLHGAGARGRLDWPPIAVLPLANVTVWDLAEDRDAARAAGRTPKEIPVPAFIFHPLF
jgi:hypothetical protein